VIFHRLGAQRSGGFVAGLKIQALLRVFAVEAVRDRLPELRLAEQFPQSRVGIVVIEEED
jgi:hypothetical protein